MVCLPSAIFLLSLLSPSTKVRQRRQQQQQQQQASTGWYSLPHSLYGLVQTGRWVRLNRESAASSSQTTERKHVLASFPNLWKRGPTTWTDFDIDGAVGGNHMADSLNDYRLDVHNAISRPTTRGRPVAPSSSASREGGVGAGGSDVDRRHNCHFETFLVQGVPHLITMTIAPISVGQELLLDYGLDYWRVVLSTEHRSEVGSE